MDVDGHIMWLIMFEFRLSFNMDSIGYFGACVFVAYNVY